MGVGSASQSFSATWGAPLGGLLIGPAFLALAAVMWFGSLEIITPGAPTPLFDKSALTPGGLRPRMDEPPTSLIGGYNQRCNDCHQVFTSRFDPSRPPSQHTHIHFDHGINDSCTNCHARKNRERLILRDGVEIPFNEVATLCQQCHGPVYRDWKRGTHGKTMGSWQMGSPAQRRLVCTECHDPHAPTYAPMVPLPGPNTLHMGERAEVVHQKPERNPLRRWTTPARDADPHPINEEHN